MLADIKGPHLDFFWGAPTAFHTALYTLNRNHSRTSFSTQIVSYSRHLCSRRDARVDNLTHAKRPI